MIESLLIRNFRIFEELTFRHFSRVNLIVGKNSIGKSTLLEAIQIYGNKANPKVLYDLIAARDEHWESEIFTRSDQYPLDQEDPIRHLFHDYHFPAAESTGIEIGPVESEHSRVLIRPITVKVTEDSEGRRIRIPVSQQELFEAEATLLEPALEIRLGEEKRLFPLSRDLRDRFYRPRGFYPSGEIRVNVQVVPTQNIPEDTLTSLWDNINLTDLEQEVTKGLQLIDLRVQGVALVGDTRGSRTESRRRIAIVRCEGHADRIPLKTMGDGMTRIFHIVLALVNAKDGLLLIDEFENGIHWTIQPLLWNTVFRIAEALNVQVFATTHSRDCVSGFFEEWQSKPELGTFHRIDTGSNQEIRAIEYDHEALSDALETQVEVR